MQVLFCAPQVCVPHFKVPIKSINHTHVSYLGIKGSLRHTREGRLSYKSSNGGGKEQEAGVDLHINFLVKLATELSFKVDGIVVGACVEKETVQSGCKGSM